MPLYEHVFLARQDASAQQVDDLTNQFKAIIEGQGGKVAKTEYWGVKSLTYRMNKNRKAHFTLMNVDAPAAAISEIERQERLSEEVLRYITIRVDELEEGPSAMMRKSDRDDRDHGRRSVRRRHRQIRHRSRRQIRGHRAHGRHDRTCASSRRDLPPVPRRGS